MLLVFKHSTGLGELREEAFGTINHGGAKADGKFGRKGGPIGNAIVAFHPLKPGTSLPVKVKARKLNTMVIRYVVVLEILIDFGEPFGWVATTEPRDFKAEAAEMVVGRGGGIGIGRG